MKVYLCIFTIMTCFLTSAVIFSNNENLSADIIEATLLAGSFTAISIYIVIIAMLIVRMLFFDTLWAIFSIFLPVLLFLYSVVINPDEFKKYINAMLLCCLVCIFCTASYSTIRMNKPATGILLAGSFIVSPIFSVVNFEKLIKMRIHYR